MAFGGRLAIYRRIYCAIVMRDQHICQRTLRGHCQKNECLTWKRVLTTYSNNKCCVLGMQESLDDFPYAYCLPPLGVIAKFANTELQFLVHLQRPLASPQGRKGIFPRIFNSFRCPFAFFVKDPYGDSPARIAGRHIWGYDNICCFFLDGHEFWNCSCCRTVNLIAVKSTSFRIVSVPFPSVAKLVASGFTFLYL